MRGAATTTERRKQDHLDLFRRGGAPARGATTLLECVNLVHCALPRMSVEEIDLATTFASHAFAAPLWITGMTGGTREAAEINRSLARVAESMGIGLGLGSGRAMLEDPSLASTYKVRDRAPRVYLAWNLGGTHLRRIPVDRIRRALDEVQADAICIHLNPAQEMMQAEGDRDFRGVLEPLAELVARVGAPVIVKETGAGLSREVGLRLRDAGVRHVDVAGSGGTSWVGVELGRMGLEDDLHLGAFWDWGIPTAASVCELSGLGLEIVASGGIRTGLDAARAIALGAGMVGLAAPVLQAYYQGGEAGCLDLLQQVLSGLKTAMLLTGCRRPAELGRARRVITAPLRDWVETTANREPAG